MIKKHCLNEASNLTASVRILCEMFLTDFKPAIALLLKPEVEIKVSRTNCFAALGVDATMCSFVFL